jgi:hypothetical protein
VSVPDDDPIRQREPAINLGSCVIDRCEIHLSRQSSVCITESFLSSGQKVSREVEPYRIHTPGIT